MKAMLFAAGLGTRLKPLTDTMPKAMVPVGGQPLLKHVIDKLRRAGISQVVINVHHFSEQIRRYVETHNLGVEVLISDETEKLLDTGGGLRKALPLLQADGSPVLLHNVDILSNANLSRFYAECAAADVALMVSHRETSRYLLFDDDMVLVGWINVKTGEVRTPHPHLDVARCHKYAFSGIHLFSPRLSERLNEWPEKFPIMDFYLSVCADVKIRGYVQDGLRLLDVGKQDTIRAAESFLTELER